MATSAGGGAVISGMLAGLFLLEGCGPKITPPLAEDVRAQLGTVGVVTAGFQPEFDYRTPGRNGAQGAVAGVGEGLLIGTLGAAGCFLTLGQLLPACAVGVATPYLAVRFAVDRAEQGVSGEAIEASEAALKSALDELSLQELLRGKVLKVAGRDAHFMVTSASGPRRPSETAQYRSLEGEGIDTTLELSVLEVGLALVAGSSQWEPGKPDPLLQLWMTAQGRLIRTRDGEELYAFKDTRRTGAARFTEWAADGARLFREDVDAACGGFARDLISRVYGPAAVEQSLEQEPELEADAPVATTSMIPLPPE